MNKLKALFLKSPQIIRYGLNSCAVTVLDVILVWIIYHMFHMNLVVANTIGVIAGFLTDYMLSVLFVFKGAKKRGGFTIYFITFLIGLVFADWLIYIGNTVLFIHMEESFNFLFSKGISIVLPFFLLYFIRKILYNILDRNSHLMHKGAKTI